MWNNLPLPVRPSTDEGRGRRMKGKPAVLSRVRVWDQFLSDLLPGVPATPRPCRLTRHYRLFAARSLLQAFLLLLPSNCFASRRRFSSSRSASRNSASRRFSSYWYFCASSFASNHFSSRCFTVSLLSSSCPRFFSLRSRASAVTECSALG